MRSTEFTSFESSLLLHDNATLCKIIVLLWNVWRARNNVIQRGAAWNSLSISKQIDSTWEEWCPVISSTKVRGTMTSPTIPTNVWKPPDIDWLKCNVDAALFKEENKVGYGLVLRDDQANFVAAKGGLLPCVFDPGIAEAYACREALRWIWAKKLTKVVIESDSAETVKAIQFKASDDTYTGRIISDCQTMLSTMIDVSFCFVRREANSWAHQIARSTLCSSGVGEWNSHPPVCIASFFGS